MGTLIMRQTCEPPLIACCSTLLKGKVCLKEQNTFCGRLCMPLTPVPQPMPASCWPPCCSLSASHTSAQSHACVQLASLLPPDISLKLGAPAAAGSSPVHLDANTKPPAPSLPSGHPGSPSLPSLLAGRAEAEEPLSEEGRTPSLAHASSGLVQGEVAGQSTSCTTAVSHLHCFRHIS